MLKRPSSERVRCMSFLGLRRWWRGPRTIGFSESCIPAVRFDPARVTADVENEIRWQIDIAPEVRPDQRDAMFKLMLATVRQGRNLGGFVAGAKRLGMIHGDAARLARRIHNVASELTQHNEWERLGIRQARWLFLGAVHADPHQERSHQAANGKVRHYVASAPSRWRTSSPTMAGIRASNTSIKCACPTRHTRTK